MIKLLKSKTVSAILAAFALYGVYDRVEATLPDIDALGVDGIKQAKDNSAAARDDLSNLYPLVAAYSPAPQPSAASDGVISVDEAFVPRAKEEQQSKPAAPDYFVLLKADKSFSLQAITSTGAIIDNHFYPFESPIWDFPYPGPNGKMIAPLLRKGPSERTVIVTENPGKRQFQISLSGN